MCLLRARCWRWHGGARTSLSHDSKVERTYKYSHLTDEEAEIREATLNQASKSVLSNHLQGASHSYSKRTWPAPVSQCISLWVQGFLALWCFHIVLLRVFIRKFAKYQKEVFTIWVGPTWGKKSDFLDNTFLMNCICYPAMLGQSSSWICKLTGMLSFMFTKELYAYTAIQRTYWVCNLCKGLC